MACRLRVRLLVRAGAGQPATFAREIRVRPDGSPQPYQFLLSNPTPKERKVVVRLAGLDRTTDVLTIPAGKAIPLAFPGAPAVVVAPPVPPQPGMMPPPDPGVLVPNDELKLELLDPADREDVRQVIRVLVFVANPADYLRVAYERSSPWTKRVTARVKVWRSSGEQVWPGNLATRRCARVVLLRFRGLPAAAQPAIIEGMRRNFEGRPETIQLRVLANAASAGVFDYLGFVEARAPFGESPLDLAPFGAHADALDTVNTYAPY